MTGSLSDSNPERSLALIEQQVARSISPLLNGEVPLAVVLPSGRRLEPRQPARVEFRLTTPSALLYFLRPSLASLGSAYVEGLVDVAGNLGDILSVAVKLSRTSGRDFETSHLGWLRNMLVHNRNRDRAAIQYHYDVSNDFYRLFLDEGMVYSCAYFRRTNDTLEQAQRQKLDHILNKLQLRPGDRFLDIGCGWGGLIVRAAQRGAHAVGITLSNNQYEYVCREIRRLGLADRCVVRLQDYREIPNEERYDKIASVGMFEHVGHKQLPTYFRKLHALLAEGGAMLMHGITSTLPGRNQVGRGGGEFIERYVFPDGELPHMGLVVQHMAAAGLEVVDVESLRRHYAITLQHWAHRLEERATRARELAGEKRFRIWRVYLAGCAHGFANNWMNIHQILACRLGGTGTNPFPMTRDWMYAPHSHESDPPSA